VSCLVTSNVVFPLAVLELWTGVNVLSAAALTALLLPTSITTWVQQLAPNWTATWLSRTCRPMSRISPVPFFRFPNVDWLR